MKNKTYTVRDLPIEERPRERLQKVGVDNLSTQELLALIIEKGGKGQSVLTLAQNLLAHFGNLNNIKNASIEELKKVKGIGFATACKLQAAFKLGEKAEIQLNKYGEKIEGPKDIFNLLKREIGNKKKESFYILSLTTRNNLISVDKVSTGTLSASLAHPREVFLPAIKNSASSVIIVHNHPSGDTQPSEDDLEITKRLIEAGKILGIDVVDHVIVSKDSFYSFKEKNLL
ncbi:MAG: DNA repair protein RadC [Candidatus Cloacimonadota bacterium]|nr:DNA repair protein RadC [Candidatus Cloacimonadota bacterium]